MVNIFKDFEKLGKDIEKGASDDVKAAEKGASDDVKNFREGMNESSEYSEERIAKMGKGFKKAGKDIVDGFDKD